MTEVRAGTSKVRVSATDELRRLLDERGVEWWPMHDNEVGYHEDRDTEFLVYGCKHVAHEWGCRLQVDMLAPEQAVEATLGRGECHSTTPDDAWCFSCSSCGKSFPRNELHVAHNHGEINFCPNCGRKVVGA